MYGFFGVDETAFPIAQFDENNDFPDRRTVLPDRRIRTPSLGIGGAIIRVALSPVYG